MVKLGNNCNIDKSAVLGYKPNRKIANDKLIIGNKAIVRTGTVIYLGSVIGNNFETGHNVVIREENTIGNNLNIWNNSTIDYGCNIGNNVKIHCNCYIAQLTSIEEGVFIAPGVIVTNDIHPGCEFFRKCMHGPAIKKGAQIGAGSIIFPFITIGEKALIGAGSVVTKNIPAESVAYGNPAKVIGSIYDLKCINKITDRPYKKKNG